MSNGFYGILTNATIPPRDMFQVVILNSKEVDQFSLTIGGVDYDQPPREGGARWVEARYGDGTELTEEELLELTEIFPVPFDEIVENHYLRGDY